MQHSVSYYISVFATISIVALLSFNHLSNANEISPTTIVERVTIQPEPTATPTPTPVPLGQPIRIRIPSINVETSMEALGYNESGQMDTPKNFLNAGWFTEVTKPGLEGTAVVAGHFDNPDGSPAIFYYLNKTKVGDVVEVVYDSGHTKTFTIEESYTEPVSDQLAADLFGASTVLGEKRLNLITCGGYWDVRSHNYTHRHVVFAKLQE